MRVAVIGFGVEGRAAVDYWAARGNQVVVHERGGPVDVPDGVTLADDYLAGLDTVDLIVRSPGVRPETLPAEVPTTSVIAEFMARCPAPVIGVTGTKGKGTTATAIAAILRAAGRRVFVGGNIGTTPLALLPRIDPDDLVVLELSSFQLMDLQRSPQIAVVLAVTPDHLNWHRDMDEYEQAKSSIARYQTPDDLVVYAADNPPAARIAATGPARRVPVGDPEGVHLHDDAIYLRDTRVIETGDVPLPGPHNLTNIAAAIAATHDLIGGDHQAIRSAVRGLQALPHRLQVVATRNGVTWVDDSLSTTPQTTIAAMNAFDGPKILVLGGSTKGVSFDDLAQAIAEAAAHARIRAVLLTGAEAPRIAAALDAADVTGYEHVPGPMTDLVARAAHHARPGDVVLLSPACSSVGDYRNYADRGDQFATAVHALPS
ncbi:UDP-N-acetylmuramoyl-L-alanine--D-glutamate ligase [Actinomadura sp. NPDC047616]|uniref:UDP-N-acetylmuramoyl-L-alanine--D-glutamate ligase n=1 Tax=Actinomadura sp. NPDC047616 TaxID=3155914 RepID=UPI0033E83ADD